MPQIVGAAILTVVGASTTSTFSVLGVTVSTATVVGTIAITAASVGIQVAVAAAMRPSAPPGPKRHRPEVTTEQKVAARLKSYGFVRVGGHKLFEAPSTKVIHRVLAMNHGQIGGFERYYLGERQVSWGAAVPDPITLAGTIDPIEGPRYSPGGSVRIFKKEKDGDPAQTAMIELTGAFPGTLDSNFRAREQALLYIQFFDVAADDFLRVYPNHIPEASAAILSSRVYDPREGAHDADDKATWEYSDNSILCYLDALRCPDLCHRTDDFSYAPITDFNVTSFEDAADVCDEDVALAAGGTEDRYTVATTLTTDMRPADIERRLLSSCDGWSYIDSDGLIAVLAGKWIAPTVTLDEDAITGFQMQIGPGQEDALNVLKPTIAWPDNQFQETECPPWKDTADITLRGAEYSEVIEFPTTSWTQAQRLAKIAVKRALATHRGTITTNLRGEVAAGHRFITLDLPWLEQSITVEVLRFFRISGDSPGCRIEFVSMDSTAWDWDEETEEGEPPEVTNEGDDVDQQVDRPSSLNITDATGAIQFAWSNPASSLTRKAEMEWRLQSAGTANPWRRKLGPDSASPQRSDDLIDGNGTYEGRMRYRIGSYVVTDWTPLDTVAITSAYADEALALFARMTVTPTDARKDLISDLIAALKTAGVWTKLDAIWVLAAHDAQAARLNWKSTSFTATAVNAPTFTTDRGYTGNGTSSYLDSGFDPTTGGVLQSLNSAHVGIWVRTNVAESKDEIGNTNLSITTRNAGGNWQGRVHSAAASVANANGSGHHLLSRSVSTGYDRYRNGSALASATQASTSIASGNIWICGRNSGTPEYSTDEIAAAHTGSALNSTEATALYNALQTYMTAVGA